MENATKALIIAGSIFLAIIIITIAIVMFTNMSSSQSEDEQRRLVEQLKDFNKEYESYAKGRMYGVDVISILNKAINNNINSEENGKITIEITLHDDLAPYKQRQKTDSNGKVIRDENGNIQYEVYIDSKDKKSSLKAGTNYKVRESSDLAYKILFDRDLTDIATFNDFKRRVFKCQKIEYYKVTGRVNYMRFDEVETDLNKGIID